MKKYQGLILLSIAALFAAGCDDDGGSVAPATISNLQAEPQEGAILLSWDNPAEGDFLYAQVQYVDPLTSELRKVNVSHFTDEFLLSGLYRKNGAYTFKVYSVSSTGTFSTAWEEVSATALKVPPTVTSTAPVPVQLTTDMLSSNASDPQEGVLANMIDGNPESFWSSNWHAKPPFPHYIQVDLPEAIQGARIKITNRAADKYNPDQSYIECSNDGNEWTRLSTIASGTIPLKASGVYETPTLSLYPETGLTFSKIRFCVESTGLPGWDIWCLAEFELSKVSYEIIDPEL